MELIRINEIWKEKHRGDKKADLFSCVTKSTRFICISKAMNNSNLKFELRPPFLVIEKTRKPFLVPIDDNKISDTFTNTNKI